MRLKKLLLTVSAGFTMTLGAIAIVIACGGSPQPPSCPQSIFLAKFVPGVSVIPPGTGAFIVPLGMYPFVSWDDQTAACAQPASATLTVTLTCTDIAGTAYVVGPQAFAQPTPTAPGPQPAGGTTVSFTMPGSILPSVCTVMGTYDVAFGGGIGEGTLSGTGDAQVCFVEPAPGDPSGDTPRLDLELLTPEPLPGRDGEDGVYTFHAGDQEYIYIRIANNDLDNKLEIDLKSFGQQMALYPDSFFDDEDAYNDGVFRIADPGDTYPADFFFDDDPLPFDRLPGGPGDLGDGEINTRLELEPGEVDIFGITINSFGACADGSCNERDLCGTGLFFDEEGNEVARDPACLQFAYVVDNDQPPRYPGITFEEEIKVGGDVDTQWGPTSFFDGNDLIDNTHKGNLLPGQKLPPLQDHPAIQLTGDNLRGGLPPEVQFPAEWFDQITLPARPTSAEWQSFFFYEDVGFQQRANHTILNGLDQLQEACVFPAITLNNPVNPSLNAVQVNADVSNGCNANTPVELSEGGRIVAQGTLDEMGKDENVRVDFESCRTIIPVPGFNVLDRLFMRADPPFVAHNFDPGDEDPLQRAIRILDQLDRELEYEITDFVGTGSVGIITGQGQGLSQIILDPGTLDPNNPFDEILGFLIYENDRAVNSPLAVPVLSRRLPAPPELLPVDFAFNAPPLAQVGQPYTIPLDPNDPGIFIPPLDPEPVDPYFNMEFFIGIETNDDIEIEIPEPFQIIPIDPDTPDPELERLKVKFGEDPINRCSEGVWKCGRIEFGDGFSFETEIFADGFESGDVSAWSTGAAADNSQTQRKEQPVGVLTEDKKLPVFTEEELRKAIELFNDDVVFDEKTIGLVTDRFGIEVPLPPIRGTYFFDEFESFRKGAQAPVVLDGSRCPAPCSGLVFEADGGGVSNLRFENFPSQGIEIRCDSLWIASNEFAGNGGGGLLINGNNNFVADSLVRANRFENNRGPGVVVASGDGNRILYNTFVGNAQAIDLGGDGITENDVGDRDTGPNQLQNYPVLREALIGGSSTISGTLNTGGSNRLYTLQFFASTSDACQRTNSRNGERLLGTADVTTDANGMAAFTLVLDSTVARFDYVSATATDDHGRTSEMSACVQVVTGVASEDEADVPAQFALDQNYPNPFNPATTIRYAVPQASPVRLEVFDLLGRLVAVLVDELKAAGAHEVIFDAGSLPSGAYVYKLTGERFTETKTLVLLK